MSLTFQLSPSARTDLNSVIDYTVKHFGVDQAGKYVQSLEKCPENLAVNQQARTLSDVHSEVKFTRCEHHYIFGIHQTAKSFHIIAILHEKMDLVKCLEGRLN